MLLKYSNKKYNVKLVTNEVQMVNEFNKKLREMTDFLRGLLSPGSDLSEPVHVPLRMTGMAIGGRKSRKSGKKKKSFKRKSYRRKSRRRR